MAHDMDADDEDSEGMAHDMDADDEDSEGMDHAEMGHTEMDHSAMDHSDMDMSTTRASVSGSFVASIAPDVEPVPINEMHAWVLHVETADGTAVTEAEIAIDGGMPEHGHGLPTSPQVTENLGNGDYLVEGIQFQMPGFWEVMFSIDDGGQQDMVIFYLNLQ